MGGELVSDSPPTTSGGGEKHSAPVSYTAAFRECLPYYLSIGLSWDDFWKGDCEMAKFYREADKLRRKQRNQELWLQGMYIYEAIGDMAPILRVALDKKAQKPIPYAAEPYPLDKQEQEDRQRRQEQERAEKMRARFMAWAKTANAAKKKEEVSKDADGADGADGQTGDRG